MKTITISDEVYAKLSLLKGKKSFSELINELIERNVDRRIEKILELAGEGENGVAELEKVVKEVRGSFRIR